MSKIALLASGSGSNVENFVNYFKEHKTITIELVLCNNPNAFVIERCKRLELPCVVFDRATFYSSKQLINVLNEHDIDFIVLAGFLWLIPPYFIEQYKHKMVNIHPALLPQYGGKGMFGDNVHKKVVENGEKESGITIHYVNECFDEGEIIFQAKCSVNQEDTFLEVAEKVHRLEYEYYPKIVEQLLEE